MTTLPTVKPNNKIRDRSVLSTVILYFFAALIAFITIYPMYYVLVLSLSTPRAALTGRVYWWPKGFFVDGYRRILTDAKLWRAYANTVFFCTVRAALNLLTSVLVAYPLTVKKLYGRRFVTMFLLIPMYLAGGIIPEYILIATKLNLNNTPWALILPGSYSIWYIILTRSYFHTIPESLRESAKLDGANSYRVLWNVYLPTSKPILAVVALYTIIGVWNSWYHASIYITNHDWQPLQMYLRRILIEQTEQLGDSIDSADAMRLAQEQQISNNQMKYTVIIVSTLPMLIAYPFFQQYFVKGVMLGSLKE